jgi:hypothetical protein
MINSKVKPIGFLQAGQGKAITFYLIINIKKGETMFSL